MSDVMERADRSIVDGTSWRITIDVIRAIEPAVEENLDLLAPVDRAWQPTDYLPDLEAENWREQVERFRTTARTISDDLLVVLVGDMVTEEALPELCGLAQRPGPRPAKVPARLHGHDGSAGGPLRKIGTATCSTPTSVSPAA